MDKVGCLYMVVYRVLLSKGNLLLLLPSYYTHTRPSLVSSPFHTFSEFLQQVMCKPTKEHLNTGCFVLFSNFFLYIKFLPIPHKYRYKSNSSHCLAHYQA